MWKLRNYHHLLLLRFMKGHEEKIKNEYKPDKSPLDEQSWISKTRLTHLLFSQIFSAFRNPSSRVCHLNISKCTLGAEDLVCLGETVRFTRCLSSLRMEGLSRMAEIIPVLIALQVHCAVV